MQEKQEFNELIYEFLSWMLNLNGNIDKTKFTQSIVPINNHLLFIIQDITSRIKAIDPTIDISMFMRLHIKNEKCFQYWSSEENNDAIECPFYKGTHCNWSNIAINFTGTYIEDTSIGPHTQEPINEWLIENNIKSLIITPLLIKGNIIGYFFVTSNIPQELTKLYQSGMVNLLVNNLEAAFIDALTDMKEIAITNEKDSEINSINSEKKYLQQIHSLLFNNISDGIVIFDTEGIIIDCNNAVEKLIGYNKEHIIHTRFRNYVHPEDSIIGEEIQQCGKNKTFYNGEIRLINNKNKIIDCEIKIDSFCSQTGQILAVISLLKDITQRKLMEKTLLESEKKWRKLVETANEGIWQIDKDNKTIFVNKKMTNMLGYTTEEMMGKSLLDFMDNDGKNIAEKNIERRKQGIVEQHDFKFKRKNNSDMWCIISTNPIFNDNGEYEGALGMITEIAEKTDLCLS